MGKVQSREAREETRQQNETEYKDLFADIQQTNAVKKRGRRDNTSGLVGEENIGFAGQGDLGTTKFDNKVVAGIDFFQEEDLGNANKMLGDVIAETRAQEQPKSEKVLFGVGRMLAKVGTETMKGLGYVAGAVPALVMQDIELMTDNFWVSGFQELEDASKDAMPVYVRDEVENGSLGRQIWSPEFWATDGADGIGFLLSAVLTGGATSAAVNGLKIGTKVASLVGKGAKTAKAVNSGVITGTQTFLESAAETKGMVDGLKADWEGFKQSNGSYLKTDPKTGEDITFSQQEVDSIIGRAGVETLAMNGLFLWGPNALQTKYLFGKGDDMADMLKGIPKGSAKEMAEGIAKLKPWKTGVEAGGKSMGAESWQELSQFAIEDYETKKGKGLDNPGLINGMIDGYIEGLTTIEGQKSMFLGAVLGLGPGAVGGYKQMKAQKKQAGSLIDLMSKSSQKFKDDISQVYQKDESGAIKLDPDTKKPLINPEKFFELMTSQSQDIMSSKLYQEAKMNGDIASAKFALSEMTIRNIFPYLQTAGGVELWKEHSKQMSEVIENDFADLGFESVEAYNSFLDETAETAKKEYAKIKDLGPAFFGIDTKLLLQNTPDPEAANEKLQQFIGNIEYNAVRLSAVQDNFRAELKKAQEEVAALESAIPRDEEGNVTHRDAMLEPHIESLNKKIEMLKDVITQNGEAYTKLFDKKEQQAAFDKIIKDDMAMQEDIAKDNAQATDVKNFRDTFRANLIEKGYTLEVGEDGKPSDKTTKQIILKDNDGVVYRIDTQFNKNTKTTDYFLKNLKTGENIPFSLEALVELGLDKPENILTRGEYAKYKQAERVVETNKRKLAALSRLISTHTKSHVNTKYNKKQLIEELEKYSAELEFWNQNKEFDDADVAKEITRLQKVIETLNVQIENLELQKKELAASLKALRQLKTELIEHIRVKTEMDFSFDAKLNKLEDELIEGDHELDEQVLDESIEVVNEWLNPLYAIRDKMQETVNDLFATLSAENRALFADKDWDKLNDNDRYLLSTYRTELAKLNAVKKDIKDLQKELNKLNRNKKLLIKYERLGIEIQNLLTRNNISKNKVKKKSIEKSLSRNQDKRSQSSPIEQSPKQDIQESSAKKHTPWSTITAVFNINEKDADGNYVLSKNWQQAARWSKVMGNIPLSDLDQYTVRFVNNTQLEEITGETPPVATNDALYAVLYNGYDVYTDESGVIYTGIAHPETYFKGDFSSIDVTRLPEYAPFKGRTISKENPATYNGEDYTSSIELESKILEDVRDAYTAWRKDIVDRLDGAPPEAEIEDVDDFVSNSQIGDTFEILHIGDTNPSWVKAEIVDYDGEPGIMIEGETMRYNSNLQSSDTVKIRPINPLNNKSGQSEEIYSGITDISKGFARTGTEKHKPKDVLEIESLEIPDGNVITKDNGVEVHAEKGMVHAKLKNGQVQILKNHVISELPDAQADAYINKIVHFIRLFNEMPNADFKSTFAFKGKNGQPTKSRMPLVSNSGKTGILNQFINWGYYGESDFSISVHPITIDGVVTKELEIAITHQGAKINIPLSALVNEKGNTRMVGDPAILQLTDFLKTKYMNVNKRDMNNESLKSFWLPTGWSKATPTSPPLITYKKYDSYNDYVLENNLYSDVQKTDESIDEIPTFVNQYITFDEETTPTLPEMDMEEETEEEAPTNTDSTELEEIVEYKGNVYSVVIKGDNRVITNVESGKVINPTSSVGKNVMKGVDWEAVGAIQGTNTKGSATAPDKGMDVPPLDQYSDFLNSEGEFGPDGGGSTFQNALKPSSKPTKDAPKNTDPKDKTNCPIAPKGKKKKPRNI